MIEDFFDIDPKIVQAAHLAEEQSARPFAEIEKTAEYNSCKVLSAFIKNNVSEACLKGSTGYGYGDLGRDRLDRVFADIMGAEDALVRHNIASGTHALAVALFGALSPGNRMVTVTGRPYDTLEETLGLRGQGEGSLMEWGIQYQEVDLLPDGSPDYPAIAREAAGARMIYIQRSRGYSLRPTLSVHCISEIVRTAKAANPQVVVMVDNCYGEFVERTEPCHVGADLIAGSLIKNPGGGIAYTGGYIAGRKDLIDRCAARLICPGIGREVGCTLDQLRPMYQGLFFAPTVVASAVKTAVFAAALFEGLGYQVTPRPHEWRSDIVQAILLGDPKRLVAFCRGVQHGSPVDSFVTPEPWAMPGYDSPVIMAAGAFTLGASIELSADAPLREPYAVWLQGGLNYPTGKTGIMLAAQSMLEQGLLEP